MDDSAEAREALRFALEEARLRQVPMRAVHTWQFGYLGARGVDGSLPVVGGEAARGGSGVRGALGRGSRASANPSASGNSSSSSSRKWRTVSAAKKPRKATAVA
ncbi:MAG: hypothetical protein M3327_02345, partial [Actinomycetota bacterium]|nr:hypothetical protein [Actinomycetota bacterium]